MLAPSLLITIERFLMERKEEIRDWVDWALKGIFAVLGGAAVAYLSTISTDIRQMSGAIIRVEGENKRLSDRIDILTQRLDRVENKVLFK